MGASEYSQYLPGLKEATLFRDMEEAENFIDNADT